MGRLRELINSFINPMPPEKSIDELAAEAGIKEDDLRLLKRSMGGVANFKFADEAEEPKKGKNTKSISANETQMQPPQRTVKKETNKELERE